MPYYRMKEEGTEVKVVGAGGARSYTSKHGYPVTVDVQAEAVTAVEFDAVIVPGGYAPDMMRRHDAMVKLVREAAQQGRVVAAICHAGWMLASAGVVKGKKVTLLPLHQGRHGECRWPVVGRTSRWWWMAT